MTAATQTIAEFLLARIAEDEGRAREAGADAMVGARWKSYPREAYEELQGETLAYCRRVLAECEAHRRIVERLTSLAAASPIVEYSDADVALVDTLRALAAIYADHPDYRAEWR